MNTTPKHITLIPFTKEMLIHLNEHSEIDIFIQGSIHTFTRMTEPTKEFFYFKEKVTPVATCPQAENLLGIASLEMISESQSHLQNK